MRIAILLSALMCGGFAVSYVQADGGNCGACTAATQPSTQPVGAITDVEKTSLIHMREEEKLAHDVYVALGKKFDLKPFANIPRSEKQHQSAVAGLMQRYGIADPVADMPEGKFASKQMQALYDKLVETGSKSEVAALSVGAQIEELDIKDLREQAAQSDKSDIKSVYAALEAASVNHLNAFMRNLKARGGTYSAQHLTQAQFDELLETPGKGKGPGRGAGAAAGQGRGRGAGR
jgi:hypothetical protein